VRAVAAAIALVALLGFACGPQARTAVATAAPSASSAGAEPDAAAGATHGIESTCPGTVSSRGPVRTLGGAECFYAVVPAPASPDYVLELEARLVEGLGYGIWFRGAMEQGEVVALAVQFDPGAGGLKFLHYPEMNNAFRFSQYPCDHSWHRWKLVGSGGTTTVQLDGETVLEGVVGGVSGTRFGFRTWGGTMELRNVVVTPK
jgi:hypothetical protein